MAKNHQSHSHDNAHSDKKSNSHRNRLDEQQPEHKHATKFSHRRHDHHNSDQQESYGGKQMTSDLSDATITSDYFVSDRKGDPDVIRYGSNNSYRIPTYRRTGHGLVLGLPRALRIDRKQSTDKEIKFIDSTGNSTIRNKAIFSKVGNVDEYRISPVSIDAAATQEDYLSFRRRKQRSGGGFDNELESSSDDDVTNYRSIKGKAKDADFIDKDLETNQRESISQLIFKSDVETNLQRLVEREPSNGQAWLDLIRHKFQNSAGKESYTERLSTADIKISMYEKALKDVIGATREKLLLGLLSEASLIWDPNKLQKKWKDVLQSNQESFVLWTEYLNCAQTNPVRFKFDDLREVYQSSLDMARATAKRAHELHMEQNKLLRLDSDLVYLLLRFTICLRQAGYVEQAIAIWQANVELAFSQQQADVASMQRQFESFWNSEVARIGEENALGFDHYLENGGDAMPEVNDLVRPDSQTLDVSTWLAYEQEMSNVLPARMTDTTDDEDTFRVVLFSDIEPYVLSLSAESQGSLVDAILLFSGLPSFEHGLSRTWRDDPFIRHAMLTKATDATKHHEQRSLGLDFQAGTSCVVTTAFLFGSKSSSTLIKKELRDSTLKSIWPERDSLPVPLEWIRRVLTQLARKAASKSRNRFLEYYLAFELHYYPQQVRKLSKNILRLHPQDLILYNTHALIEYRLGNSAAATKVLQTAMNMRPGDPNITILKWTMIWEALEDDDHPAAFNTLVQDSKLHGQAATFETQQTLLTGRDNAKNDPNRRHLLTAYIDCLVLLTYLSNPDSLEAAMAVFDSNAYVFQGIPQENEYLEIMHQSKARLLRYHMARHQYKPAAIRKAVEKSIHAFPTNTTFLDLWQINERRYRIYDRIRSVANDILSGTPRNSRVGEKSPLVGHLFAISTEMQRETGLGSSSESVRSAFERALSDRETRSSPAIWSHYINFELSRNDANSNAREVVSRSIAACPWILAFHLLSIGIAPDTEKGREVNRNFSESRAHYDAALDRELRIHMLMDPIDWR